MKLWFHKGVWISKRARIAVDTLDPFEIKRAAVIRHAALGDMILTRNFLIELRKAFPNAFITLSVASNYTSGIPKDLVDRVHRLDTSKRWLDYYRNMKGLESQDIIFDLAATTRSMWMCKISKAKLKIGFPYHTAQRHFYDVVVPRSDMCFEVDNMLNALKIFGFVPQIPYVYNLPGAPLRREKPYILYFTTASAMRKCWHMDRFVSLINKMTAALPNFDHVIQEGTEPWESAAKNMDGIQNESNVYIVNAGTVENLISNVKGAVMVIANDTSVRNIAIAAGVPSIGIFLSAPIFRYLPMTNDHRIVFNRDASMPEVEAVLGASLELLRRIESAVK